MSLRLDSWANAITGLGHSVRDKVAHTEFSASHVLSDETLEALYHGDDMAARVCDLLPDEMLRQGFQIQCDDAEPIHKELDRLGAREKLNEVLIWFARIRQRSALHGYRRWAEPGPAASARDSALHEVANLSYCQQRDS